MRFRGSVIQGYQLRFRGSVISIVRCDSVAKEFRDSVIETVSWDSVRDSGIQSLGFSC